MRSEQKKMIFMGSDPIALPALNEIYEDWSDKVNVVACYTQPDRRTGRGKKLQANAIKLWAQEREIEVRQPDRLSDEDVAFIRETGCDFVLVMAYGHILRKAFLETAPLGTYNLHASILPKYRGAAPLNAAVAAGDTESGVSLMRMVRKLDAGPVADVETFPIERLDTTQTLSEKAARACVPLMSRNLDLLLKGELALTEQDEEKVSFTRKLEKGDGCLDFSAPAPVLARRINALYPWPSVQVEINEERVRLGLADYELTEAPRNPGEIIAAEDTLQIATGEGVLKVLRLQRPGGRMLDAKEFLRGFRIATGQVLPSELMRPLIADKPFVLPKP